MTLTKDELRLAVDALQFTCCGDICSDIDSEGATLMAKLSVKICKELSYKSTDNYYYKDTQSDDEKHLELIKNYIRTTTDEDE